MFYPIDDAYIGMIDRFYICTKMAKEAGFDAIEVNTHVGYLLDQFMSEGWNHRTDEYGGSFENRMRFTQEIIDSIRKAVGEDYPLIFRLTMDHKCEDGRSLEEGLEILKYLDKAGVDAFSIDDGSYAVKDYVFPTPYLKDAFNADTCKAAKSVTDKPVMTAGNISAEAGLKAYEEGKLDYIMIGRGLVADPNFVNKLKEDKEEEIRNCLRCNFCISGIDDWGALKCGVNPEANNETAFRITKTDTPKKVVVVGGGPGGLEAARVAAVAGHGVTLFEKGNSLGGQALASAAISFKKDLKGFVEYQINQVHKLGVDIRFNSEITPESPELADADEIIVALGARPINAPIPGADATNVYDILEVHLDKEAKVGDNVVIIGGGISGCEYALEVAMEGKNATVVEMRHEMLIDSFEINKLSLSRFLDNKGVNLVNSRKVVEITDGKVITEDTSGNKYAIEADTVVMAIGATPLKTESDSIQQKYPSTKLLGDCVSIGLVGNAVRDGYFAAYTL